MFTLVDGSSSTQNRFDLMVASTKVLNAETAVSEIGRVFIRKELGSGLKWETNLPFSSAFVPPPLAANMLRTQDPISLEMSCFAKHNLFTNQICLVLQKRICSHEDVLDQYYWCWFDLVKVFISCNWWAGQIGATFNDTLLFSATHGIVGAEKLVRRRKNWWTGKRLQLREDLKIFWDEC